jgi:hypothetical protein
MREPSSFTSSTCWPGSGTRGGLLLPNVISLYYSGFGQDKLTENPAFSFWLIAEG